MEIFLPTIADTSILARLIDNGLPPKSEQPVSYAGMIVVKPWGYECQLFDSGDYCVWLMCLRPGTSTSLHCHQRKQAMFVPLTDGIQFNMLGKHFLLTEAIAVGKGRFHGQQNVSDHDTFLLECETPSEKTDLVRYRDSYHREGKPYEGKANMLSFADATTVLDMPSVLKMLIGRAA